MKARVKLLTLWAGSSRKLPRWFPLFKERMASNRLVEWELVEFPSVTEINTLYSDRLQTPCRKERDYGVCDLRPMIGSVLADRLKGFDWWGWCDMDIVTGNLDEMLVPLLDSYSVVTDFARCVAGPLTVLKNEPRTNDLFRSGEWGRVMNDPRYCNFDEDNFGGKFADRSPEIKGHFTAAVRGSGLPVLFSDKNWDEARQMIVEGGVWQADTAVPSRNCELRNGRLIEVAADGTEREIITYHLGSKVWPLMPDGKCRWNWTDKRRYFDRESVYAGRGM